MLFGNTDTKRGEAEAKKMPYRYRGFLWARDKSRKATKAACALSLSIKDIKLHCILCKTPGPCSQLISYCPIHDMQRSASSKKFRFGTQNASRYIQSHRPYRDLSPDEAAHNT